MCVAWGWVDVKIYTPKIDGLSESDFILAARIAQMFFQREIETTPNSLRSIVCFRLKLQHKCH